uniref:Uncharacterized protein B11E5.200 n=1 Tax=Neurospora crassa TaxID=5141 RepID=Q6MVZ6_NEUCS|nr:hypothetical protein [Neurospora crassa]
MPDAFLRGTVSIEERESGIAVIENSTRRTRKTLSDEPSTSARTGDRNLPLVHSQMSKPGYAVARLALSRVHNSKALMHASQNVYNQIHMAAGLSVFAHPACN